MENARGFLLSEIGLFGIHLLKEDGRYLTLKSQGEFGKDAHYPGSKDKAVYELSRNETTAISRSQN